MPGLRGVSGGLLRVGVEVKFSVGVGVDIGVARADVGVEGVDDVEGATGNGSEE